jgi:hypothetical protein
MIASSRPRPGSFGVPNDYPRRSGQHGPWFVEGDEDLGDRVGHYGNTLPNSMSGLELDGAYSRGVPISFVMAAGGIRGVPASTRNLNASATRSNFASRLPSPSHAGPDGVIVFVPPISIPAKRTPISRTQASGLATQPRNLDRRRRGVEKPFVLRTNETSSRPDDRALVQDLGTAFEPFVGAPERHGRAMTAAD